MTDSPPNGGETPVSRRKYLLATGGLAASHLVGQQVTTREASERHETRTTDGRREDFLWFSEWLWRPESVRDGLFAFAHRHDLAVLLAPGSTTRATVDQLRPHLEAAAAFDLDVWLRLGVPVDHPVETLVTDPAARETHLDRIRSVVRLHADLFDGGRVVLWEEAPVMGEWIDGGAWNVEARNAMLTHGPELFDRQRSAVREVADYPVGIFVHFPYVVDSKLPDVFPALIERLRDRGDVPDFGFTDFYRGWYEKDVGPGPADAAVRSLVANASDALNGRPVYYLGQAHTVNPEHTPSRQSIRSNLRASLAAGADGVGWYLRSNYVPTTQGFDPLVPNEVGAAFAAAPVGTLTVARDRFHYAWQATLATRPRFDPAERFDLWLVGDGVGFYDLEVWLEQTTGDPVFVGHVDGYVPGDYPYAPGGQTVSIVRGLRRDRFLRDGLSLRVVPKNPGPDATLDRVLVMPCDPAHYLTEPQAERLLTDESDGPAPVEFGLGEATPGASLAGDGPVRVEIPIDDPTATGLAGLRFPEWVDAVERLRDVAASPDYDPENTFDLWIGGNGLDAPGNPALREPDGGTSDLDRASAVAVGSAEAALYYGLDRDRFTPGDGLFLVDVPNDWRVDAIHAMPFAGTACFRPPDVVSRLLASQPEEVATYSIWSA